MSRIVAPLTLWALAALACVFARAADVNLVGNAGFEEVDAGTSFAKGWDPTYWSNPHGKVVLSAEARTGERCVVVTGVPPEKISDATPRNNNLVTHQVNPSVKGVRKLKLEAWFRAAENAKAYCSVMTQDADGNRLQYVSSGQHSGTSEWTRLFLPVSTAAETANLTVYLRNDGEGPVWYDDVSLTASDDVLENEFLRVHVEPLVGGRVRSLVIKKHDRDATFWSGVRPGGLAADIIPADVYPGLLRDSACEVEVQERHRRVLLRHQQLPEPLDGLVIEKEVALRDGAAVVDVRLRVRNSAAGVRNVALRAQQCLPPRQTTVTVPVAGQLRVVRHQAGLARWGLDLNDLHAGWIACSDAEGQDTLLFRFDRDELSKAYLYRNQDLQTVEWSYRQVAVPAGEAWETTYSITVLHSGVPVAAVSDRVAVGVSPLATGVADGYSVVLSPLSGGGVAHLAASGQGQDAVPDVDQEVSLTAGLSAEIELPWQGRPVARLSVSVRVDESSAAVTIAPELLDASPIMVLPEAPARFAEFPAATGSFPYGEYYRGYVGEVAGSVIDHVRRQLRAYRRCYMNTYMSSEGGMLSSFRKSGTVPMLEEVRKRRMRIIPRADMLRRFERDESGRILKELPPGESTREAVLERLTRGGFTPELRRRFVRAYGDLLLAYDFADEPQGQYIPNYMMLQTLYRDIDPDHPVLVILNLNRTEFLPFMPVYYGDEYPIRNEKHGGRNPWGVSKMVRFCATHTKAPVWVMLQAFGGLPEYTWQLPNEAEMRLTIYEAIANGCKGVTFHGSSSPPCWRYNRYYAHTARDSWGVETPAWEAMRDVGRHVTAIGPVLLNTDVSDEEVLRVECEQMTREDVPYRGPAIRAGVLKRRAGDGWFVVVVNQDVERVQRGTLSLNGRMAAAGSVLCDLHGLETVETASPAGVSVELTPGDGRIFFVGPAAATESVLPAVHKGRYDNELPLFEMEAEMAVANGCDVTHAAALAEEGAKAGANGEHETAHAKIAAAREALAQAIGASPSLSRALAGLTETQALLSDVALTFGQHIDVVVPPEVRKATPKNAVWKNTHDPKLQGYVDETAEAMCLRMELEDKVYAGQAADVVPQSVQLEETAARLKAEAIPYVLARAKDAVR